MVAEVHQIAPYPYNLANALLRNLDYHFRQMRWEKGKADEFTQAVRICTEDAQGKFIEGWNAGYTLNDQKVGVQFRHPDPSLVQRQFEKLTRELSRHRISIERDDKFESITLATER